MPKKAAKMSGDGHFKVKKTVLDETNQLSYIPDGRNPQADYYRLENRQRQIAAIDGLSPEEQRYVLGLAADSTLPDDAKDDLKNKVQKIHEKDLIELRCLVYLQSLPDTSPEMLQLKTMCGCETREQIASFIADKQIKKLLMSQVERIAGGSHLTDVYNTTIVKGPQQFAKLFDSTGSLF